MPVQSESSPIIDEQTGENIGFTPINPSSSQGVAQRSYSSSVSPISYQEFADQKAKIADLEHVVDQLTQLANHSDDGNGTLESLAMLSIAQNTAYNAKMSRNKLGKAKGSIILGLGVVAGAGGMYIGMRNLMNEYAAAAQACEVPADNPLFTEDNAATNFPITPTTIVSQPATQGFQSVGAIEAVPQQQAGNLRVQGSGRSVQQYSDGSFVESDTLLEWKILAVNPTHDTYSIQLLQPTDSGYLPDATMQRYIAEGEYTKEELLTFFVANNIVDPNVTSAYIQIVGSGGEELIKFAVGVPQ
jgi:hypothetical protein